MTQKHFDDFGFCFFGGFLFGICSFDLKLYMHSRVLELLNIFSICECFIIYVTLLSLRLFFVREPGGRGCVNVGEGGGGSLRECPQ